MAALNMYNYVDIFRSKDVKGSDLLHLDKEKLVVSIILVFGGILFSLTVRSRQEGKTDSHYH